MKKNWNIREAVSRIISGASPARDKVQAVAPSKSVANPGVTSRPIPTKAPTFPYKKNGAPEAYRYKFVFVPSSQDAVLSAIHEERWYLTARVESGKVHLYLDELDLGLMPERTGMMTDWLTRGDPYIVAIEEDKKSSGYVVTVVFYKDKQKYNAHKEQTVVALTGYKSEEKQYTISILEEGEELEAEEDLDHEGRVQILTRLGDTIGSLPKKCAQRIIDEGTSLIVFDHEEPVEDSDISKPFVKIYW